MPAIEPPNPRILVTLPWSVESNGHHGLVPAFGPAWRVRFFELRTTLGARRC